ncbi:MAG: hypothetical protein ACK6DS_18215, partial [Planctomycetota bacterium]
DLTPVPFSFSERVPPIQFWEVLIFPGCVSRQRTPFINRLWSPPTSRLLSGRPFGRANYARA